MATAAQPDPEEKEVTPIKNLCERSEPQRDS